MHIPTALPADRRVPRRPGAGRPFTLVVAVTVLVAALVVPLAAGPSAMPPQAGPAHLPLALASDVAHCPWLETAMDRREPPAALAAAVVARMRPKEKFGEITLQAVGPYENADAGVPRLCIPSLTLQDGPQGVAYGAVHVTQLPDPLALAATFDPSLARRYGDVQGQEAAGQGFDVVQGPTLNVLRVPESGRAFEGFGEDPLLAATMAVADIRGIQSQGVMAQAKHLVAYSQETDRGSLNAVVSARTLREIYLPPFEAAVRQGHVASVMCAYPQLNGVYQCQDPALVAQLHQWGFTGFVRSDLGAVHDPVAALTAGVDLIKPLSVPTLTALWRTGSLPMSVVDAAVRRVLTQMFAWHLIGRPPLGSPGSVVDSPDHAAVALVTAERSAVLLKNAGGVLPLSTGSLRSVAVIGADASSVPVTTGRGSAEVVAPFVSTPLAAITARAGPHVRVVAADGGSSTGPLRPVPDRYLTPDSGIGHGLSLTLTESDAESGPTSISLVEPTIETSLRAHAEPGPLLPGPVAPVLPGRPLRPITARGPVTAGSDLDRSQIVLPAGWSDASARWSGTLTPPRTGLYTLSLDGAGAATLTIDGRTAVSDPLQHATGRWSQAVELTGGHPYRLVLDWTPLSTTTPSGETRTSPSSLSLGWQYDSGYIARAVAAARSARVAVVFAGDYSSEAFDKPSLSLPGDENILIDAVAAANPRTVVVLNTSGPVFMPWLDRVAAVLEAWYPGEQDGAAAAALLFGAVDPSGRLPVTFPVSTAQSAINTISQWPGINLTSTYSEGLAVGYRYNHVTGTAPLFPFGFGLAYTRFTVGGLRVTRTTSGVAATVRVANVGNRAGTAVPQAYLTFPPAAGEPPGQLVAFSTVRLAPHASTTVTLPVPTSAFMDQAGPNPATVPGTYLLEVGQSSAGAGPGVLLSAP